MGQQLSFGARLIVERRNRGHQRSLIPQACEPLFFVLPSSLLFAFRRGPMFGLLTLALSGLPLVALGSNNRLVLAIQARDFHVGAFFVDACFPWRNGWQAAGRGGRLAFLWQPELILLEIGNLGPVMLAVSPLFASRPLGLDPTFVFPTPESIRRHTKLPCLFCRGEQPAEVS
jgi:hypothetical protein